jgi:ketosteroid isomerase-like protein
MRYLLALPAVLLFASVLPAQQRPSSSACPATEKAILDVRAASSAAFQRRDFAAMASLVDEQAIISADNGKRLTKDEQIAGFKRDSANDTVAAIGPLEDVVVKFSDGVALLNFLVHTRDRALHAGIEFIGSYRESYVFACRAGQWKIIFRAEIPVPNLGRAPDSSAVAHLDDYIGRYRFYQHGEEKGEASVFRKGDMLYERWGKEGEEQPDELIPGRFDTFFIRYDGTVERFLRDKSGKVIGIHYMFWDDDAEARRIPDSFARQ